MGSLCIIHHHYFYSVCPLLSLTLAYIHTDELHWLHSSVNLQTSPLSLSASSSQSPFQPVCLFWWNWNFHLSLSVSSFSISVGRVKGSCLAHQCSSESYSGRFMELTAGAVSTSSGYDWVCRGNGMADEFRPPWGEWVIEKGRGGRSDSYWTVLRTCSFKIVFFQLLHFSPFSWVTAHFRKPFFVLVFLLRSKWLNFTHSQTYHTHNQHVFLVFFGAFFPSQDHSENPLGAAVTLAHELGHNFGMNHDTPERGCGCRMTVDRGGCIMTPSTGWDFGDLFHTKLCSWIDYNAHILWIKVNDTCDKCLCWFMLV